MLTPDQFRFITSHLVGLTLAGPYRLVPKSLRNEYNYLPGILMVYYCFGSQANSFMLFSAVSYVACRYTPPKYVQRVTMALSLSFLSYAHLSRQLIDYGGYVIDISGPFMIAVQKLSSLGFCLHDGGKAKEYKAKNKEASKDNRNLIKSDLHNSTTSFNDGDNLCHDDNNNEIDDSNNNYSGNLVSRDAKKQFVKPIVGIKFQDNGLTEEQEYYAVEEPVGFRDFMGYFFHFPSVMCGPIMYYKDYTDFIRISSFKGTPPGALKASFSKLLLSSTSAMLLLLVAPKFQVDFLRSPEFLVETPFVIRFFYILIFTVLSRLKYYVAWHLGEAVSNATGFGFNGYDQNGKPKWDLISNMELWRFETCSSLRDAILAWNKTTQNWLRRTAYERAQTLNLLATYTLSAIWHGYYPGYYMTFLGGALFTQSARVGRRKIRPLFQRGKFLPKLYDVVTFTLTRLTIAYIAFPFVILDFNNSLAIYKSLYFSLHILGLAGICLQFVKIPFTKTSKKDD